MFRYSLARSGYLVFTQATRVQIPVAESFLHTILLEFQVLLHNQNTIAEFYRHSKSAWPNWIRRLTTNQEIAGSSPVADVVQGPVV